MDAGSLDKRIMLQRQAPEKDAYGHPSFGWVRITSLWANVRQVKGNEAKHDGATRSESTHTIAVRYHASLMDFAGVRIALGLRIFNINAARDLNEAHEYIIYDCIEVK
jgi:SPP1 family predicted phage head-tail adaptor